MKHTPWSDEDLIKARVAASYNGYTLCKTFYSVLTSIEESKPTFYSLTFLQNGDIMKAIFTKREREIGGFYHKVVKEFTFSSKEEGNAFFLKVQATRKVSKSHMIYYRA